MLHFDGETTRKRAVDALGRQETKISAPSRPVMDLITPRTRTEAEAFVGKKAATVGELERRSGLLRRHLELREEHKTLVGGGAVTESEFWEGREAGFAGALYQAAQTTGIQSESLVDCTIRGGKDVDGMAEEVQKVLDKETIRRIFLEHPEVLKKYQASVPEKMSGDQFWTAYMHSKYVLGTKRNYTMDDLKNQTRMEQEAKLKKKPTTVTTEYDADGLTFDERAKKSNKTVTSERQAEALFGNALDYRFEQSQTFKDELENLKSISQIDKNIDLRLTRDDAISGVSSLSGLGASSGYGIATRDLTDGVNIKSAADLMRQVGISSGAAANKIKDSKSLAEEIEQVANVDPLLSTINRRGTLALRGTTMDRLPEDLKSEAFAEFKLGKPLIGSREDVNESELLRKERLMIDYQSSIDLEDDLKNVKVVGGVPLKLKNAAISGGGGSAAEQQLPSAKRPRLMEQPSRLFDKQVLRSFLPTPESSYSVVVSAASKSGKDSSAFDGDVHLKDLQENVRRVMFSEFASVDEYCRHFWTLFNRKALVSKANATEEQAKRCKIVKRMAESELRVNIGLRHELRSQAPRVLSLLKAPLAQLETCIERHATECKEDHRALAAAAGRSG